jgi:hypothetical protein
MKYEHPRIAVSSPAPGHYFIANIPASNAPTDEGLLVSPDVVHIPPSLPSDLLLAIVEARGDLALQKLVEIEGGDKDSGDFAPDDPLELALSLILQTLNEDDNGTMRIRDLSVASGVATDLIKRLDGQGFELGAAGWVKLKKEGGEA